MIFFIRLRCLVSKRQCTVNIFGSKSGHFWTINQVANYLIPWTILNISQCFYVEKGLFSLKNAIEIIFKWFLEKIFFNFMENFFLVKFLSSSYIIVRRLHSTPHHTLSSTFKGPLGSYLLGKFEVGQWNKVEGVIVHCSILGSLVFY